jgi:hypothetical protein
MPHHPTATLPSLWVFEESSAKEFVGQVDETSSHRKVYRPFAGELCILQNSCVGISLIIAALDIACIVAVSIFDYSCWYSSHDFKSHDGGRKFNSSVGISLIAFLERLAIFLDEHSSGSLQTVQ